MLGKRPLVIYIKTYYAQLSKINRRRDQKLVTTLLQDDGPRGFLAAVTLAAQHGYLCWRPPSPSRQFTWKCTYNRITKWGYTHYCMFIWAASMSIELARYIPEGSWKQRPRVLPIAKSIYLNISLAVRIIE